MTPPRSSRTLSLVALFSCFYDVAIGVVLLTAQPWLVRTFGVAPPQPPIFVELNSVFLLAVGVGYLLPYMEPQRYRGYLWVMGPVLKGGGAVAFVVDHLAHGSPRSFLLFALSDGAVALLTLWALLATPNPSPSSGAASTGTVGSPRP